MVQGISKAETALTKAEGIMTSSFCAPVFITPFPLGPVILLPLADLLLMER